ncbi:MAG TPA: peptidoglycan-associated lipoprotein Pal, partial [Accumulibacter sp.]|nr:peptidoglycan-associated lipoprotein Pal [Accumulibacter sp.]
DGVDGRRLPAVLTDPKSVQEQRVVYFDYDSYEVKSEYKDLVTAHAKFLTENRQFKMLIQGNTDERGSREYNLALGQKRSDAIKKMLLLLGAREDQLEAVSLGEEKPKNEGHNEAAWAQNRRGDMLYSGEF